MTGISSLVKDVFMTLKNSSIRVLYSWLFDISQPEEKKIRKQTMISIRVANSQEISGCKISNNPTKMPITTVAMAPMVQVF